MNAPGTPPQFAPHAVSVIKAFQALRRGSPSKGRYWEQVAGSLRFLCRATAVWVVRQAGTDGAAGRLVGDWLLLGESAESESIVFDTLWLQELGTLVPRAGGKGYGASPGVTAAACAIASISGSAAIRPYIFQFPATSLRRIPSSSIFRYCPISDRPVRALPCALKLDGGASPP